MITCIFHKGFEYEDSSPWRIDFKTFSSYLSHDLIQILDTLWILKKVNSDVMIPSPECGKPLVHMEVAKCHPIRCLDEFEVAFYGPRRASQTVTPACRPPLLSSIAFTLCEGAVANQAPSLLVAASRSIQNPNLTTGMTLVPSCNSQIHAICSVGFNARLQFPIECNKV